MPSARAPQTDFDKVLNFISGHLLLAPQAVETGAQFPTIALIRQCDKCAGIRPEK
jgi:hypothetical protein